MIWVISRSGQRLYNARGLMDRRPLFTHTREELKFMEKICARLMLEGAGILVVIAGMGA